MHGRQIKETLKGGGRVLGTFFHHISNPTAAELLPTRGLDFVVVTTEHNALGLSDFLPLQIALRGRGIACLARTHSANPDDIARICDSFPDGVVVPYVEDPLRLQYLMAAAKYRPLKGAALERLIETGEWPSEKTKAYIEEKCADTLFCPMIESVDAMENLDAICSVPNIDAVFVGPNDLSVSMGIPEERDNPEFIAAMQAIIDTAERHGIAAGGHFSKREHGRRLIEQGARFIPFSSDIHVMTAGFQAFTSALADNAEASDAKII